MKFICSCAFAIVFIVVSLESTRAHDSAGVQNRLNGFESNQTDLHVTKVLKSTSSSSLFNIHLMKNQTRVLTAASASKTAPSIQTRKEKAKKLAAKKQKKAMIKNKTKANFKLSKKEDIFVDPRSAPTRKTADCGKHRCGKKKMQRKNKKSIDWKLKSKQKTLKKHNEKHLGIDKSLKRIKFRKNFGKKLQEKFSSKKHPTLSLAANLKNEKEIFPKRESKCYNQPTDIVFIVDGTQSQNENFQKMLLFVSHIVDSLPVNADETRVGIMQRNNRNVETEIYLSDYFSMKSLIPAILRIERQRDVGTGKFLRRSIIEMFSESNGARNSNVRRIMILISDGIWPQSYGVIQAIKDADAAGIERFALNVGNSEAKNNLESFVSSPIESHLIKVDGLSDLKPVIPCLNKFICNGDFCNSGNIQSVPGFDILQLANITNRKGVSESTGSVKKLISYHIKPQADIRINSANNLFSSGFPWFYSIVSTFHMLGETKRDHWVLLEVRDSFGGVFESVRIVGNRTKAIEYVTVDVTGKTQTLRFEGVDGLFSDGYHKVALFITPADVLLSIDCEDIGILPLASSRGVVQSYGEITIAKKLSNDETVEVKLQQLDVICDMNERSLRHQCCELQTVTKRDKKCASVILEMATSQKSSSSSETNERFRIKSNQELEYKKNRKETSSHEKYSKIKLNRRGEKGKGKKEKSRGYGLETKGDGFMFGLPEKNQNKKGGTETHKHGNLMNENPGGTKQRIIGQVDAPDKIIDEDVKPLSTPPTAGVTPTTPTSLSDDNECICEKKMRQKGDTGSPGPNGDIGPRGLHGLAGERGPKGSRGKPGQEGGLGRSGRDGEIGVRGEKGEPCRPDKLIDEFKGARGQKGSKGGQGEIGKQGQPGEPSMQRGMKGHRGVKGSAGRGLPGPQGKPGPQGEYGPVGEVGPPGEPGIQGFKGVKGNPGKQGDAGEMGESGPQGPKGHHGIPGKDGPAGYSGVPGPKGHHGNSGPPGPQGEVGKRGPQGPEGLQGELGEQGIRGEPGRPGIPGPRGPEGSEGPRGVAGEQGQEGYLGPKGDKGGQGLPGWNGNRGPPRDMGEIKAVIKEALNEMLPLYMSSLVDECKRCLPKRALKGSSGSPGPIGTRGGLGLVGPPGLDGERGHPGKPGINGEPGRIGVRGDKGDIGSRGISILGPVGLPGPSGKRGKPGNTFNGRDGEKGPRGYPGRRGAQGQKGPEGFSGMCDPSDCNGAADLRADPLGYTPDSTKGPPPPPVAPGRGRPPTSRFGPDPLVDRPPVPGHVPGEYVRNINITNVILQHLKGPNGPDHINRGSYPSLPPRFNRLEEEEAGLPKK